VADTVSHTCSQGHTYEYECRCICDPFGGGICNACLDAESDCPECWRIWSEAHPFKITWMGYLGLATVIGSFIVAIALQYLK